jgi:hypothetical protein
MNEDSVEADDAAFAILERSLQKQPGNEKPLSSHGTHNLSENGRRSFSGPFTPSSTETCGESILRRQARGKLPLEDFAGLHIDPDLAYGTYYPAQDQLQNRPVEILKRGLLGPLGISRSVDHGRDHATGRTEQQVGDPGIKMIDVQPYNSASGQEHCASRPEHLHMSHQQSFNPLERHEQRFPPPEHQHMPNNYGPSFTRYGNATSTPPCMGYGQHSYAPPEFGSSMAQINRAQVPLFGLPAYLHASRLNPAAAAWQPPRMPLSKGPNSLSRGNTPELRSSEPQHRAREYEEGKSDFFYTPCSTKSQIAETSKHSHPDVIAQANTFRNHPPVDKGSTEGSQHNKCLRVVSPKPLEDV